MTPFDNTIYNMRIEGSKRLGFGKYRGQTYENVYMTDYGYCKWCLTKNAESFSMFDFQQYICKVNFLQ